jgi:hypothetical protein
MCDPSERCLTNFATRASEEEGAEAFRRDLLANLPGLIGKAMQGYSRFTTDHPPDDAKGFVAYQAGCRAALTHIHLLVKLADWASSGNEERTSTFNAEQLDRLVREAEAVLRNDPVDED